MLLLTTVPIVLLCAILNIVRITEGPQVFYVRPADTSSIVVFDKIYVQTNITTSIPCTVLSCSSFRHRPIKPKHHLLYLSQLLILRSSDTELNPGPRAVKFPCGVCSKGCFWRQRAICCDSCETWYHVKCLNMKDEVYLPYTRFDETFTCFNCGIPNFSSGLFDTVFGDSITNQVANNGQGPSESSI